MRIIGDHQHYTTALEKPRAVVHPTVAEDVLPVIPADAEREAREQVGRAQMLAETTVPPMPPAKLIVSPEAGGIYHAGSFTMRLGPTEATFTQVEKAPADATRSKAGTYELTGAQGDRLHIEYAWAEAPTAAPDVAAPGASSPADATATVTDSEADT